jgi:hypothetical protein
MKTTTQNACLNFEVPVFLASHPFFFLTGEGDIKHRANLPKNSSTTLEKFRGVVRPPALQNSTNWQ